MIRPFNSRTCPAYRTRHLGAVSGWLILIWIMVYQADCAFIETVAGTGKSSSTPDSGPAKQTPIGNPFGVEIGPDEALYICEVDHHRIRRLNLKTGILRTIAGTGKKGWSGDGGSAVDAELNEPYEVRFSKNGDMYFVEMKNHLIRKVDAETGFISTVAGKGVSGFGGDGGPAITALFNRPHSIALDDAGHLFVADIGNHRIRRINLKSGLIETIAGNGERTLPIDGSLAANKPMLGPRALFYQHQFLWIALREGHSIWKLNLKKGRLTHISGTGKKGFSGDGGSLKNATFNGPKGIALDKNGRIYVADTENQAIRLLDREQDRIVTLAGKGPDFRGPKGDGGPADSAELNRPHGIGVDSKGIVYIGDSENHRVRRVRH